MYYLVLFIILILLASLDFYFENKKVSDAFLVVGYILFVCTAGLKYETGVDWRAYGWIVDDVMPINLIGTPNGYESVFGGLDVGFTLLISIIKFFGGGLQTLFFIISLTSTGLLVLALRRYCLYPLLGMVLYYCLIFFYLDMSGIRQATSLCIFFYSIKFIKDRQLFKYLLFMLLAFTLHWSSLFLIPLYWVLTIRVNKVLVAITILVSMIIYFLKVNLIVKLIPSLFKVLQNSNMAEKVITYSTTDIFVQDRGIGARTILHIALLFVVIFMIFRNKKALSQKFAYFKIFSSLFLLQAFLFFFLFAVPELMERIKLYFFVSNIVLLTYFVSLYETRFKQYIAVAVVMLYSLFYGNTYILQKSYTISYFPYQNYLIYKALDIPSTGEQRLNQQEMLNEQSAK